MTCAPASPGGVPTGYLRLVEARAQFDDGGDLFSRGGRINERFDDRESPLVR